MALPATCLLTASGGECRETLGGEATSRLFADVQGALLWVADPRAPFAYEMATQRMGIVSFPAVVLLAPLNGRLVVLRMIEGKPLQPQVACA